MKRSKNDLKNPVDDEPVDGETEQTIAELRKGLDHLDQLYPVDTPRLEWFQQITWAEKRSLRRRLMRELALFWFVATAFLSVYLVAFNHLPGRYIAVVQVLVAIGPIIILIRNGRRVGNEPNGQ